MATNAADTTAIEICMRIIIAQVNDPVDLEPHLYLSRSYSRMAVTRGSHDNKINTNNPHAAAAEQAALLVFCSPPLAPIIITNDVKVSDMSCEIRQMRCVRENPVTMEGFGRIRRRGIAAVFITAPRMPSMR